MYSILKRLALSLLPSSALDALEFPLRSLYYPFVKGDKVHCPCCNRSYKSFQEMNREDFEDQLCPGCGSIQRTRLLREYLNLEFPKLQELHILHFSPHKYLRKIILNEKPANYYDTDFVSTRCRYQFDITALELDSNSLDLIISYHIFEHIPNDRLAMQECFRTLKPNGRMLAQVPWREERTIEDPSITDPKDRLRLFGQEDHVRYYGREDFIKRLEELGFEVQEKKAQDLFDANTLEKESLRGEEIIFDCFKP